MKKTASLETIIDYVSKHDKAKEIYEMSMWEARNEEVVMAEKIYFTITGTNHYHGKCFLNRRSQKNVYFRANMGYNISTKVGDVYESD